MEAVEATYEEIVNALTMENAQLRLQLLASQISNEKLIKQVRNLEQVAGLEEEQEDGDADDTES